MEESIYDYGNVYRFHRTAYVNILQHNIELVYECYTIIGRLPRCYTLATAGAESAWLAVDKCSGVDDIKLHGV